MIMENTFNSVSMAKVITSIMRGDAADYSHVKMCGNDSKNHDGFMLLFKATIIPRKNRYLQCFTIDQKEVETVAFVRDAVVLSRIFDSISISEDSAKLLFRLAVLQDYRCSEFKEICAQLLSGTIDHQIIELRYDVLLRIVSIIVHSSLYSAEPYLSILNKSIEDIDKIESENPLIRKFGILED